MLKMDKSILYYLSSDEQEAFNLLAKVWKNKPIEEAIKRYANLGVMLIVGYNNTQCFERWIGLHESELIKSLQSTKKVVNELVRYEQKTNNRKIRKQDLTTKDWKRKAREVLTKRWKLMDSKEKGKLMNMRSLSNSGITIDQLELS